METKINTHNIRKNRFTGESIQLTDEEAKKHNKFITRKGQYDKPDGTKGKSFVSKNGVPCLVYWDLDNDGWRMAVGETRVRT